MQAIDEMNAADVLHALEFSLSYEGLKSLSDEELRRMESMLYHWHQLAVGVVEVRRMRNHG